MCNILNNFFSSVFSCEDSINVLPEVKQRYLGRLNGVLNGININREKVLNKLKKTSVSLSVPLSIIFNHSFNTGIVLNDWKKANVSAIFKKGDQENPGYYRPISLTSQVCKVFEFMSRDAIVDHLKKIN